jgi:predicted nucleic-acid-binding Zn-ribbon protein
MAKRDRATDVYAAPMRTSRRCVKCQCPRLWHIDPVLLPDTDSRNSVELLPGITRLASGSAVGTDLGKRTEAGRFEVWICTACGYTEWYAHQVNEALAWLTRNPRSGVHYYDADAPTV